MNQTFQLYGEAFPWVILNEFITMFILVPNFFMTPLIQVNLLILLLRSSADEYRVAGHLSESCHGV